MKYSMYKPDPAPTSFDSGLMIVDAEDVVVAVSPTVLAALAAMEREFPRTEYCLLASGDWRGETFLVGPEYYIPDQEVGYATVERQGEIPPGMCVLIHKHPRGITSPSFTDREGAVHNWAAALIWSGGEITYAVLNIPLPGGGLLALHPKRISTYIPEVRLSPEELRRVMVTTPSPSAFHPLSQSFDYLSRFRRGDPAEGSGNTEE